MSIGTMEVHIMFIMAGHKNFKNEALVTLEGFSGQKNLSKGNQRKQRFLVLVDATAFGTLCNITTSKKNIKSIEALIYLWFHDAGNLNIFHSL